MEEFKTFIGITHDPNEGEKIPEEAIKIPSFCTKIKEQWGKVHDYGIELLNNWGMKELPRAAKTGIIWTILLIPVVILMCCLCSLCRKKEYVKPEVKEKEN